MSKKVGMPRPKGFPEVAYLTEECDENDGRIWYIVYERPEDCYTHGETVRRVGIYALQAVKNAVTRVTLE